MPVKVNTSAFVSAAIQTIGLSSMFSVTAGAQAATYLVVTALDRDEYTASATGATGGFTGNGNTAAFASAGDDSRGAGIVFTYQASTGRYYNATYGYFDQVQYSSSGSAGDITNISVFATSSLGLASADAADPDALMQADPGGYGGSVTVATEPGFTGAVPTQATPQSLAAVADSFVGDAWNVGGCWVLASAIAAEAGASLPVQTTAVGLPGQASGEWIVAFDGPAGQSGNWQSMVTAGEIVVFGVAGGGGHITTCVSGSGGTAMLVDNAVSENALGQIANPANDGSNEDVAILAPHAASQEWAAALPGTVVIYELDTPDITEKVATDNVSAGGMQTLSSLFAASDPANKAIASYQIYDTALAGGFVLNGVAQSAHSAATALTVTSLASVAYAAGAAAGSDTIEIRAFNGSYWNDWQGLGVTVTAAATAPPRLNTQTAAQTWTQGQRVSFALPASTFVDPQGQTMTYSAALSNGQALPNWLSFNSATETFSGIVPSGTPSFSMTVTATDVAGLSATDQFSVTVPASPPVVAAPTPGQQWRAGQAVSLALPKGTFADPQGEAMTYSASQTNGQALPGWLSFNAATDSFSGTAPITAQMLGLQVTATDTSGLSVSENFLVSIVPAGPVLANPTPGLAAVDGHAFTFALPANTFVDTAGQHMTYLAYQLGGPAVTSWLHFNPGTETLYGTPPKMASGTAAIEIVATDGNRLSASETFNLGYGPG
jgi:hypothetical protein